MLRDFLAFYRIAMSEVRRLGTLRGAEINDAKVILADEATRLCHGKSRRKSQSNCSNNFQRKGMSDGCTSFHHTDPPRALSNFGTYHGRFCKIKWRRSALNRGGGARSMIVPSAMNALYWQ